MPFICVWWPFLGPNPFKTPFAPFQLRLCLAGPFALVSGPFPLGPCFAALSCLTHQTRLDLVTMPAAWDGQHCFVICYVLCLPNLVHTHTHLDRYSVTILGKQYLACETVASTPTWQSRLAGHVALELSTRWNGVGPQVTE